MTKLLIPLLCAGLAVACGDDTVTGADDPAPNLEASGPPACYSVRGTISETGEFPSFSGVIAGDLVGTTSTLLSFDVKFAGAVIFNPGERWVAITGGSIPELVGRTLHVVFEGLSVFNAPPLISLHDRERVGGGADRGNLTAHGTLNWDVYPWALEQEYYGVICP